MLQTQHRGPWHLRILRPGTVQRLHPVPNRSPHSLLGGVRGCVGSPGAGHRNTAATKPQECASKHGLLLPWSRFVGWRGHRSVVHAPIAFLDPVRGRLRPGPASFRHLVWQGFEKKPFLISRCRHPTRGFICAVRVRNLVCRRPIRECKSEMFSRQ